MKLKTFFCLFVLLVGLGATAAAQTSASVIKIRPEQSSYKVKAGAPAALALIVEIDDGYHINSNRPTDKNLKPTVLKFGRLAGLGLSPVVYPKGKMQKFGFSAQPLSVYEGKVVFKMTARALASLAAGPQTLKGTLAVQACNNEICLRPQTVDVAIAVEVVK